MSASGSGCGPGPGHSAGTGASNPRKFSEKIALHTQRQAEETAAFQEVMMDISSTRLQAQKLRLARTQGPYYGGSLPNVNQIGRTPQDFQGSFPSALESNRSTRHHGLVERVQRDRRFLSPVRPYRNRTVDSSPYNSAYLSPPSDPSWRRTNSDSALHTSVMNPPAADPFTTGGHTLTPQIRRTAQSDGERSRMFPYPVPPIEENVLSEGKLLKPWDNKKLPMLSSRPKSCEVPDINVFTSPEQPSSVPHGVPSALNTGGSLPDLSSLHFPSPLPTPLDQDEPYPSLSGGSSTGNLASTLTQLGINAGTGQSFHQHTGPGLMASLQNTLSNPSLPSSLSNPNLQSSLSFPASLSSASLHSSLSNPSLQSSLSSSPLSLSSQSLHSSLSSSSLQSGAPSLSTSPRRRAQLSPLILPMGAEPRRHHAKQFSPTISPTLSSITQGVPLDTSKLPLDQRLPPYPLSQNQQRLQSQQLHNLRNQQNLQPQQHNLPPQLYPAHQQRPMVSLNNSTLIKNECLDQCGSSSSCQGQLKPDTDSDQRGRTLPQLQQISHNLATDLGLYNDALFNSLLDDPYLMQLTGKSNQQFSEGGSDGLNHSAVSCDRSTERTLDWSMDRTHSVDQDSNQNQSHGFKQEQRHNVPNIILTGDSPPGLSKEITSALSHVPGFEMDPFSLDDPLRMDSLALDMLDGDLMLADPAVEDSFRSDRLK